jgi:hypothetical protein
MISYPIQGRPKTVRQADVSNAADTTVYTVPAGSDALLQRLRVCNKTAGAVTVDVWYLSGSANYILKGKSIAANDTLFVPDVDERFEAGAALVVRASAATSLDFAATFLVIMKNTPGQ